MTGFDPDMKIYGAYARKYLPEEIVNSKPERSRIESAYIGRHSSWHYGFASQFGLHLHIVSTGPESSGGAGITLRLEEVVDFMDELRACTAKELRGKPLLAFYYENRLIGVAVR